MQVCLLRDDELLSSYDDNLHRLSVAVVTLSVAVGYAIIPWDSDEVHV
jgi:hypothetical protein